MYGLGQSPIPSLTAPARSGVGLLLIGRRTVPGQQLVDTVDLVVGDALENVGKPDLRVDSVVPCSLDQV